MADPDEMQGSEDDEDDDTGFSVTSAEIAAGGKKSSAVSRRVRGGVTKQDLDLKLRPTEGKVFIRCEILPEHTSRFKDPCYDNCFMIWVTA